MFYCATAVKNALVHHCFSLFKRFKTFIIEKRHCILYQYLSNKYGRFIITLIVAIIGGMFFKLLHIPVPWLLGLMIFMILGKNVLKCNLTWHNSLCDKVMVSA